MTCTLRRALQGAVFGTASALGWVVLESVPGLYPLRSVADEPLL